MITHAQERFDQEYKILRKLVISGEMTQIIKPRLWVRERGKQALLAARREIEYNPRIIRMLSRQSGYQSAMDDLTSNKKKNGEEE